LIYYYFFIIPGLISRNLHSAVYKTDVRQTNTLYILYL